MLPSAGCPVPAEELEICPVTLVPHGLEKGDVLFKPGYGYRCGGCSVYIPWPDPY